MTEPINLAAPKGVIRISISVMMPRPERPDVCDSVDCEPMFFNVLRNKDKKHVPVELMPKLRTIIAQMCELARSHAHAPLPAEKLLEEVPKPSGPAQIEVYAHNPVTGEMRMMGEPLVMGPNGKPLPKIEV